MSAVTSTDIRFSEEQAMLLDSAREFCRDKFSIAQVRSLLDSDCGYDPAVWRELVDLGWLGIAIPEHCGGSGMGIGTTVCIAETMGRYLLSTPFFSTTLAAQAIYRAGSAQQHNDYLSPIADGAIASLALLENEDWGDLTPQCSARDQGQQLLLSGNKKLVCDASVAELFVVSLNYQGETTLAVVQAKQLPDNAISDNTLIDQTKRAATLQLDGLSIDKSALLSASDANSVVRDIKLIGALLAAAEATGSCAAALDCIVDYLKTRTQFGKPIGAYQALKHPAVDILNDMDSSRSLIYHAATTLGDEKLDNSAEIACRMAKAQASDALIYAGDRAVQFHGGMGFTYECDAQLYIRRAQWLQQHFGDALHHRKRLAPLLLDQPLS